LDLIESGVTNPINHWYYKHKFWFILNSGLWSANNSVRLIDIGAGSALFSKQLVQMNVIKHGVAVDTGYAQDSIDPDSGILFRRTSSFANFSHFLLTDVLEHIENDEEFLSEIVDQADPGSLYIVTVPALMSLWSGHDVYLKHFRRYTKTELCLLVKSAGLEIVSARYTYSTVFPLAYFSRKMLHRKSEGSQLKENSRVASSALQVLLLLDRWISRLPFGVSLFLVAKKPN
jgi:2-polyprenyl-3-methyl-5-hydroxy-6-metoxy-1,4-benzoquinol methylase